jgi:hypothetical protein
MDRVESPQRAAVEDPVRPVGQQIGEQQDERNLDPES